VLERYDGLRPGTVPSVTRLIRWNDLRENALAMIGTGVQRSEDQLEGGR
jgi:hypothetical protein